MINVKIKCAYHLCNKETEQTKSVKSHLHFMKGTIPVTEERQYCSKQCAENDQMAHEL
ncbi:rtr1/RPAP2 family protein [Escherichia coli TW07509]|nr:Rtr1/RPAP2 family protein [Escherichia coli 9.0111]ERC58416.1 rtr1/RPAP2 family protein [Escherichia coli TW07509]